MRLFAISTAMLLLGAGAAGAGGEWRAETEVYREARPAAYAKGCYWQRGERYCSSYCYVEINGKHYCNARQSEAVPQGDPYKPVPPTVEEIYRRPRADR